MNLQYILDGNGQMAGVFIPIEEWNSIKDKFHEIDTEQYDILQWHKDEIDRRLEAIENGDEQYQDYNEAIDDILKQLEEE